MIRVENGCQIRDLFVALINGQEPEFELSGGIPVSNFSVVYEHNRDRPKSDELPNSNEDASLPLRTPNNELVDSFSASDSDSDSEGKVDSTLETTLIMILPTRLGRIRTSKSDDRLPACRNDINVKWQKLVT
ncbi:hypothetical protein ACROYT_G035546 [Oculina patagonica]